MIRKGIFAFAAAAILVGAAAAHVPTAVTPKAASAGNHSYTAHIKPAYVKGSIAKNCLSNQGECGLVVR